MKYNFKFVIVSTLLCSIIGCNVEAMHKPHIHHNQQVSQYINNLDLKKISIDLPNKELEKYAYDNRERNTKIGDKYYQPSLSNYPSLDNIRTSNSNNFIAEQYNNGQIKDFVNGLLYEHIRFFNHHSTKKYWEISGYFLQAWLSIWHCIYNDTSNKRDEQLIERLTILFQHFMPNLNIDYFQEVSMKKW